MNVRIVYDSVFGNTEKIAHAIGKAVGTEPLKVSAAKPEGLRGAQLLIVGSPTRAFRPTPALTEWLKALPQGSLSGVRVAAFDTRINTEDISSGMLKRMAHIFGYAAAPIAKALIRKGGVSAAEPEGFYVKDTEGPLKDGEAERAAAWAAKLTE